MNKQRCAKWKCDNVRKDGYAYCEEHPPLVDHGLKPNTATCPECGNDGMGTIHDDMWYCSDSHGREGCGELIDPYKLAGVEKDTKWEPPTP